MTTTINGLYRVTSVLRENFGDTPQIIEATLAAMAVAHCLFFDDLPHCIGLNLVGPPSSGKTTVMDLLEGLPFVYRSDKFTPKAFVSHYAAVDNARLSEIDLLPRIKGKILVIPELAPLFECRLDDLMENIGMLTRVFDGRGLTIDSGVQGQRGYQGDYRFVWLAATTPFQNRTWQVLGKLGGRWVFLPVEAPGQATEKGLVARITGNTYRKKIQTCKSAVHDYMLAQWDTWGGFGGVDFTVTHMENEAIMSRLATAARECSEWRGLLPQQDAQGFNVPVSEDPMRLFSTLYHLARGYALMDDRIYIERQDVLAVERIASASMPEARRRIYAAIKTRKHLSTSEIIQAVGCSRPTAHRLMEELASLGVIEVDEDAREKTVDLVEYEEDRSQQGALC